MPKRRSILHSLPTLCSDDFTAVEKTMKTSMIASWEKVEELELNLTQYIGAKKAKATCSGTSALALALLAANIGPGDEVITPTYVCKSVLDAIKFTGAKPVVVDIDDTYCISPSEVEKHIGEKTKAVIVAHMYGINARILEIGKLCEASQAVTIEDCAQSIGGVLGKKKLGSMGDFSIFSFHATKVMTSGEGGMVLVNNREYLERFEEVTDSNMFALSDMQASLALNQLKKLDGFIRKRRRLAREYIRLLKNHPDIYMPITDSKKSIFFRFPIRMKKDYNFDALRARLEGQGIHIRKGVDLMLHQVEKSFQCPIADELYRQTISLPIYPHLNKEDVSLIVEKFIDSL